MTSTENFSENYSWADERLQELYNHYSITPENIEDFMEAGLLNERWAYVDERLEELYGDANNDEDLELSDEYLLEKKRAWKVSDLKEDKEIAALSFQNNYTFEPISNPFCSLIVEQYNYVTAMFASISINVKEQEDESDSATLSPN
jgi:hypothetical protein